MAITATDVQRVITLRVGDLDPTTGDPPVQGGAGLIASNMPTLWALHADKASVAPRLQELYTQRDAIDLLIAVLRQYVDTTQGDPTLAVRLNQRVTVAQQQRKDVEAEITFVEQRALATRGAALGQITTTEPVSPADAYERWRQFNPFYPDAGSQRYSGSPYAPVRRRY